MLEVAALMLSVGLTAWASGYWLGRAQGARKVMDLWVSTVGEYNEAEDSAPASFPLRHQERKESTDAD